MADYPQMSGWTADQMGFDPEMAAQGQPPALTNPFHLAQAGLSELGNIAYQVTPDPVIAAGRAALRGTPYGQEKASLDAYKAEQAALGRPSEVVDPKFKQTPPGLVYDNPQQYQKSMDDTAAMVMGIMGGGPIKPRPGSGFSDVGKGFRFRGQIHDTGPFHDLTKLPEGLQGIPDAYLENPAGLESGWILKGEGKPAQPGTSPEFPRFVRREDYGKPGPNMLGQPEFPTTAANEPQDPFLIWRPSEGPSPITLDQRPMGPPADVVPLHTISPQDLKRAAEEVAKNKAETDTFLGKFGTGEPWEPPLHTQSAHDALMDQLGGKPPTQSATQMSVEQIRKALQVIQESLGRPIKFSNFSPSNEPVTPPRP